MPENPFAGFDAQANYHPIVENAARFGKIAGPIGYAFGAVVGAISRISGVGRPNTPYIVDIERAREAGTPITDLQWSTAGYGAGGEGYLFPWQTAGKVGPQINALSQTSLFRHLYEGIHGPAADNEGPASISVKYTSPYLDTSGQTIAQAQPQPIQIPTLPVSSAGLNDFLGSLRMAQPTQRLNLFLQYLNGPV